MSEIICITVSYNYLNTLKFCLPINYNHFKKIYIITQEDDIDTINFCKKFDNLEILYFNFKNNNKKFDKFGAIKYAQTIAYKNYPDSWYLLLDSDIILPENFIELLEIESLSEDIIYGAYRYNIRYSSELLIKENIFLNSPDIFNDKKYNYGFYSYDNIIIGSFQLYKKKILIFSNYNDINNIEHNIRNFIPDKIVNIKKNMIKDYGTAAYYDIIFPLSKFFKKTVMLDNIKYLHCGKKKDSLNNWRGVIREEYIIDKDIPINLYSYSLNKDIPKIIMISIISTDNDIDNLIKIKDSIDINIIHKWIIIYTLNKPFVFNNSNKIQNYRLIYSDIIILYKKLILCYKNAFLYILNNININYNINLLLSLIKKDTNYIIKSNTINDYIITFNNIINNINTIYQLKSYNKFIHNIIMNEENTICINID